MTSSLYQGIATNVITGFLGSGKTTAILHLLQHRPAGERWAVLVNEFGEVGIDGIVFAHQSGVFIKEVPGGCICCTAGLPLQMALNLLIKEANPDRLLIEPTGVGHPKKILQTLHNDYYQKVLSLKASICLVDAKKIRDPRYLTHETFMEQIHIADILLANQCDQATPEDKLAFEDFAHTFAIPKQAIDCIEFGRMDPALLNCEHNPQRLSITVPPSAHSVREKTETPTQKTDPQASDWQRIENQGQGYYACGWVFAKRYCFDQDKIVQWAKNKRLSRVKGSFLTPEGAVFINRSDDQFQYSASRYLEDSRVEIIEPEAQDWNEIEQGLLQCMQN